MLIIIYKYTFGDYKNNLNEYFTIFTIINVKTTKKKAYNYNPVCNTLLVKILVGSLLTSLPLIPTPTSIGQIT
jgi:hypothetical protein